MIDRRVLNAIFAIPTRFKLLTAGAAGLLLGFGLCGVDSLLPSSRHQEFGGVLSFTGFALCLGAACLVVIGLLWVLIAAVVDFFVKRT